MKSNRNIKYILSLIIFITFFLGESIASLGLIIGSIFLIKELINRKYEAISILFIIFYIEIGLKSVPGYPFQYIEALNQNGDKRPVSFLILPEYISVINFGSFDISIHLLVSIFFFVYYIYLAFATPFILSGLSKVVIYLFAFLFIPSILCFIIASFLGINGALAATKALMGLTVFFYGYAFGKQKSRTSMQLLIQLKNKYIYILAVLLVIGLVYNHIVFLYIGVATSLGIYILVYDKEKLKFLLILVSVYLGTIKNTFTIMLIPITSGIITYFSLKFFKRPIIEFLPKLGLIVSIAFLGLILSIPKEDIQLKENITTEDRLYNKIFGDRYFVWTSYLEEIKDNNIFFAIPEEKVKLETVYETEEEVFFGAHNTLIQLLYYFGIVPGGILFLALFYFINKMIIGLRYLPKVVKSIAYGLLGVFIIFSLTGHSIVTHASSIFFWLFVGIIAGLGEYAKIDRLKNIPPYNKF